MAAIDNKTVAELGVGLHVCALQQSYGYIHLPNSLFSKFGEALELKRFKKRCFIQYFNLNNPNYNWIWYVDKTEQNNKIIRYIINNFKNYVLDVRIRWKHRIYGILESTPSLKEISTQSKIFRVIFTDLIKS